MEEGPTSPFVTVLLITWTYMFMDEEMKRMVYVTDITQSNKNDNRNL